MCESDEISYLLFLISFNKVAAIGTIISEVLLVLKAARYKACPICLLPCYTNISVTLKLAKIIFICDISALSDAGVVQGI